MTRPAILHIEHRHEFLPDQLAVLVEMVGQPVDVVRLAKLDFPVYLTRVEHGNGNDFVYIDHPIAL